MNIHFGVKEKLDPYWGIAAGYRIASYTQTSTDPDYDFESFTSPLNVGFETTLGLRYYFTDNIGVYGEIGLAQSVLQLGLAVKF